MGATETALGTAAITVGLAGLVGIFLHRFVDVSEPKTAVDYGRKWLGWGLFLACISQLPSFFRSLDANSFAVWVLAVVVISPIAFLIGWLYGKYKEHNNSALVRKTQVRDPLVESYRNNTRIQVNEKTASIPRNTYLREAPSKDDIDAPQMLSENALYEIAWKELEVKKGDKGLWAKAYSICEGETEKARAYYIRERVRFLSDKQNVRLAKHRESKVEAEQEERWRQLLITFRDRKDMGEYISVAKLKTQLIEKGYLASKFNLDTRDANDRTPLMNAAMNGDAESVVMLLIAGADKSLISPFGDVASQIARNVGYKEIASLIDEF